MAGSQKKLEWIADQMRRDILTMTSRAGSGHPTSSLSGVELMTALFFGGVFRANLSRPENPENDRLIFSKGHAAPLFYALYAAAGKIKKQELNTLRKIGSRLEGHPTMRFPYTESPTGSLGQGLSIGVGMAIEAKYLSRTKKHIYVLLGDSEMAEGQIWEALQLATHYKLSNLVGIIDVNRLGQTGATMYGHNLLVYQKKIQSFGWSTFVVDGHKLSEILHAYNRAQHSKKPSMIIAKTIKGKGVPFLENKNGFHGKALDSSQLKKALEMFPERARVVGKVKAAPNKKRPLPKKSRTQKPHYSLNEQIATRTAYGHALASYGDAFPSLVVLDAEVSNSTKTEQFKKEHPKRFFEMFIAEQNMVSTGVGIARRGHIVSINSFAAFLSRAADQIRMSQYTGTHLIFGGSHAGVSIGPDGSSQMGLQDLALFRSLFNSVVLYPSDAVSAAACTLNALKNFGLSYIRTTRGKTPVLYKNSEVFPIGKSKTLARNKKDVVTVIAAGITVHEALKAHDALAEEGIYIRVIDAYSIKPIDASSIKKAARETSALITVEDHVSQGGLADAVRAVFTHHSTPIYSLAVTKIPQSGTPDQLLAYEGISHSAIIRAVRTHLEKKS